mmetsp:Transcript_64862/g.140227  ORF Transcript_64862/g.140227 Transcript_64862/m.140227 type:complete len:224 (+) Transcript_64862:3-674(+)
MRCCDADDGPILVWAFLASASRSLRPRRVSARQLRNSLPGLPSRRDFAGSSTTPAAELVLSVPPMADCFDSTGRRDMFAERATCWIAEVRPRKDFTGYSRILHTSSVATRTSSSCSTMTTEMFEEFPSSSPTSRLMIFRKPRRISFSSSMTSPEALRMVSFSFSWPEIVSRSVFCAWSMWLCHSFCVRRHLDWKAIFTPPPRFITSAWTIGLSSLMASSIMEW